MSCHKLVSDEIILISLPLCGINRMDENTISIQNFKIWPLKTVEGVFHMEKAQQKGFRVTKRDTGTYRPCVHKTSIERRQPPWKDQMEIPVSKGGGGCEPGVRRLRCGCTWSESPLWPVTAMPGRSGGRTLLLSWEQQQQGGGGWWVDAVSGPTRPLQLSSPGCLWPRVL